MNDLDDEDKKAKPQRGCFVVEDDFSPGQLLAVHSIKGSNDPASIMGQAFTVKAVCLPFFTVSFVSNPVEIMTMDTRYINVMRVSKEYAESQKRLP